MGAVATPSILSWRANAHLSRAAQDVYSSFQKTKIEAVRRNQNCAIRFSVNDFMIYVEDDPAPFNYDGDEIVISSRQWSEYPGILPPPNNTFYFKPNGFAVDANDVMTGGTVTLIDKRNRKNEISITAAGSIKVNRLVD
jgi:Tfp pilus assembly protein FimT